MKYYVLADVHGYYTLMMKSLEDIGYFKDCGEKKLIICGDIFDRGLEAKEMQAFITEMIAEDKIIIIKGNHEDLAEELLNNWHRYSYYQSHHIHNGTVDTVKQLTGATAESFAIEPERVYRRFESTDYIQKIIGATVNYYETEHYIFVHGWVPCRKYTISAYADGYRLLNDWRSCDEGEWGSARWINGMAACYGGGRIEGKTVVCGHYHASFGHSVIDDKGSEFGDDADFSPFYGEGIIALDGCTFHSGKVNCIVIED